MVNLRLATLNDANQIIPRLRKQDLEEVKASHGLSGKDAVLLSLNGKEPSYVAELDGKILCFFGCDEADIGGSPWLLGTDELSSFPISLFRKSRKYIDSILNQYGYLENYVDARNTLSIQWLKWLGFTIENPLPYGVEQKPFHRFWKAR
jgi:hypothetical protein